MYKHCYLPRFKGNWFWRLLLHMWKSCMRSFRLQRKLLKVLQIYQVMSLESVSWGLKTTSTLSECRVRRKWAYQTSWCSQLKAKLAAYSNIIKMLLFRVCRTLFFSFGHCIKRGTVLFFNLCQGVHCSLVGWFVSRIAQKLLNRYKQRLDGGWLTAQNRPRQLFMQTCLKGLIQEYCSHHF